MWRVLSLLEFGTRTSTKDTPRFRARHPQHLTIALLRQDLQSAGIAYEDESGKYADLHSLRHTFISNVGGSGATVKETQSLARHSTSALTLDVYTHIGLNDERQAVENLPELHRTGQPSRAVALKTGTDNRPLEPTENSPKTLTPKLTPFLTPTAYSECNQSATIDNQWGDLGESGSPSNSPDDRQLDNERNFLATVGTGKHVKGGGRIRTDDNGFAIRRLRPLGYAANYLPVKGSDLSSLSCFPPHRRTCTTRRHSRAGHNS